MKSSNLIKMLIYLLERKKCTAKELSDFLSVSQRTIYRYIDSLSLANIPIYSDKGKNGGISIREDFFLNKTLKSFDSSNLTTLLTALKTMTKTVNNESFDSTLKKIKELIPAKEKFITNFKENKLLIDTTNFGYHDPHFALIDNINLALDNFFILKFKYVTTYGEILSCSVEPYRLIFKQMCWFLQGYSIEKNTFKIFNLANISNLTVTNEKFSIRYLDYSILPPISWIKDGSPEVTLLFHKDIYPIMKKYYGKNPITKFDSSHFKLTIEFSGMPVEYGFLFALGNKVQILAPSHIRDTFANSLKEVYDVYFNTSNDT
ncbi:MAG: helix-turn-helix transcriptional regulator [Clostridium sp.]